MEKNYKIALLIDSENVSSKYIEAVMNELSKYGTIVISRFYGDITKSSDDWKEIALKYSLKPMHQYNVASKKNAADMAMALDAQEIMYHGKVNAFFLVTSDSDFTPLANKLKENGMFVVGIGSEKKVSPAFKASCKEFKYFEYLADDENEDKDESEDNGHKIGEIIKDIIVENGVDNTILLSRLGDILVNRFSDFDSRKYGAKSLSSLVKAIKGLAVIQDKTISYVKLETQNSLEDIERECFAIISKKTKKEMNLNRLKQDLEKKFGTVEYRVLGYTKFSKLIQSIDGLQVINDTVTLTRS